MWPEADAVDKRPARIGAGWKGRHPRPPAKAIGVLTRAPVSIRTRRRRDNLGRSGAWAPCPERRPPIDDTGPLSNFLAFRRQMDCMVAALELACGNIKNKRSTLVDVVETEETSGGVIPEDDAVPPVGHEDHAGRARRNDRM